MRKTRRGFTLVEIIVTMAIMALVATVIFTIFFTNNNMLKNTEIKSELQRDGDEISEKFVKYGSQSICLNSIGRGLGQGIDNGSSNTEIGNFIKRVPWDTKHPNDGYGIIYKISLLVPKSDKDEVRLHDDYAEYNLLLDGNKLGIDDNDDGVLNNNEELLSENVEKIGVKLIGFNDNCRELKDVKGISLKVKFKKKKGKNEITYELTNDINFRNNQYKDKV